MAGIAKDLPAIPSDFASNEPSKPHTGVFRRITSKLRSPSQSWIHPSSNANGGLAGVSEEDAAQPPFAEVPVKDKPKRKLSKRLLSLPGSTSQPPPNLENSFTSPEQRQAALRARGLLSSTRPGRDGHGYKLPLSEQEEQLDKQYAVTSVEAPRMSEEKESEAQRIREAWLRKNGESSVRLSGSPERQDADVPSSPREDSIEASPRPVSPQRKDTTRHVSPPRRQNTRAASPQPDVATTAEIRATRANDPIFAPSGIMAAMQAYRPENYRPPPPRKQYAVQRQYGVHADFASDSDSEESI